MNLYKQLGLASAATFLTNVAHAAALDTTAASAAMSSISDTVPVIGGLFLGVLGLMAAWKLARGLFA